MNEILLGLERGRRVIYQQKTTAGITSVAAGNKHRRRSVCSSLARYRGMYFPEPLGRPAKNDVTYYMYELSCRHEMQILFSPPCHRPMPCPPCRQCRCRSVSVAAFQPSMCHALRTPRAPTPTHAAAG